MADRGRQQTWILGLWIAWEAIQGIAALFGIVVDSKGAVGTLQQKFVAMTEGIISELIVPLAFLAALASVTFGPSIFSGVRSRRVDGSDNSTGSLEAFVQDRLLPAMDRLDGLIFEIALPIEGSTDLTGILLRDYLLTHMRQKHTTARRLLENKARGHAVDIAVLRDRLCEAVDAYNLVGHATLTVLASCSPAASHFAAMYERWKQADERVDQGLSELIGSLPERSVVCARLRMIRLRFP